MAGAEDEREPLYPTPHDPERGGLPSRRKKDHKAEACLGVACVVSLCTCLALCIGLIVGLIILLPIYGVDSNTGDVSVVYFRVHNTHPGPPVIDLQLLLNFNFTNNNHVEINVEDLAIDVYHMNSSYSYIGHVSKDLLALPPKKNTKTTLTFTVTALGGSQVIPVLEEMGATGGYATFAMKGSLRLGFFGATLWSIDVPESSIRTQVVEGPGDTTLLTPGTPGTPTTPSAPSLPS